jgi:hypothetical protein
MKKIIFAVVFSFVVASFLIITSSVQARGRGDDREGYEDTGISGEDGEDSGVQNRSEDDDPNDQITPQQNVNEGAGPITDDDGGM